MRDSYSPNISRKSDVLVKNSGAASDTIDTLGGAVVVEFGTPWCGYCRKVAPMLEQLFANHPDVHHIQIEDGRGRRLGRWFNVKLWPTLIFMHDGKEITRLVRPNNIAVIEQAFLEQQLLAQLAQKNVPTLQ